MKLILFLFICLEIVLASVHHSRREVGSGVITIEQDGRPVYIPEDIWDRAIPEPPRPEFVPQKLIALALTSEAHCTLLHMREPREWLIRCEAGDVRTYVFPAQKKKADAISAAKEWLITHDQERFVIDVRKLKTERKAFK